MFAGGRTTKERSEKKRKRIARDALPVCWSFHQSRPFKAGQGYVVFVADRSWLRDQSKPSVPSPFPLVQSCGRRPRCDRILTPCPFEINLAVYREPNLHRIWLSFFSFFPSSAFFYSFSVLSLSLSLSLLNRKIDSRGLPNDQIKFLKLRFCFYVERVSHSIEKKKKKKRNVCIA